VLTRPSLCYLVLRTVPVDPKADNTALSSALGMIFVLHIRPALIDNLSLLTELITFAQSMNSWNMHMPTQTVSSAKTLVSRVRTK